MLFKFGLVVALVVVGVFGNPLKVPPSLELSLLNKETINVFLTLESPQSLLAGYNGRKFNSRAERKTTIANSLKGHAATSQKSLLEFLSARKEGVTFKSFWISNEVYLKDVDVALVRELAKREDVVSLREERRGMRLFPDMAGPTSKGTKEDLEWGLSKIDVQSVWDQGINGSGVRVGIMDTGVRQTHEALSANYVGEYGWFDPAYNSEEPFDSDGHGTHCIGTATGQGGIGVAPGAKWMACLNLPGGGGGEAEDLACGQFMLCPTLPDGSVPDCTRAADVVSNSWGWGAGLTYFDPVFEAWGSAGIVPVFAAGNSGYGRCGTLGSPGDSAHPALVTVGASDIGDLLVDFSSLGPAPLGKIKPEIAGPGLDVRSSCYGSDVEYCSKSGTSMAAPHVAGVIALIMSAHPTLTIEEIQERLYKSAAHTIPPNGINCGDIPETSYPNNHVGHGRLSASAASFHRK